MGFFCFFFIPCQQNFECFGERKKKKNWHVPYFMTLRKHCSNWNKKKIKEKLMSISLFFSISTHHWHTYVDKDVLMACNDIHHVQPGIEWIKFYFQCWHQFNWYFFIFTVNNQFLHQRKKKFYFSFNKMLEMIEHCVLCHWEFIRCFLLCN